MWLFTLLLTDLKSYFNILVVEIVSRHFKYTARGVMYRRQTVDLSFNKIPNINIFPCWSIG